MKTSLRILAGVMLIVTVLSIRAGEMCEAPSPFKPIGVTEQLKLPAENLRPVEHFASSVCERVGNMVSTLP